MNSGQDTSPDLPKAEAANTDIDTDADSESLQRSREAINQGHEAARDALPDEADLTSGPPEPPSGEEHAGTPPEGESER